MVAGFFLAAFGILLWRDVVLRARVTRDLWPLDSSTVGPNLLASAVQALIVAFVMALLYPPFRAWLRKGLDAVLHAHFHHHRQQMIEHHATRDQEAAAHRERLAAVHRQRLDELLVIARRIDKRERDWIRDDWRPFAKSAVEEREELTRAIDAIQRRRAR